MKETLLGNHNVLSATWNPLLLSLLSSSYCKNWLCEVEKNPWWSVLFTWKRSLTASKSGACIYRLSFLGSLPGAEGPSWRRRLCAQAELSFYTAVCVTCTHTSLLEKGIFKKSDSKSYSLKNQQQDSVFQLLLYFSTWKQFQINQKIQQQLINFTGTVNLKSSCKLVSTKLKKFTVNISAFLSHGTHILKCLTRSSQLRIY